MDQVNVDATGNPISPNLVGLVFEEDKAGYLAGALAAQMSEITTSALYAARTTSRRFGATARVTRQAQAAIKPNTTVRSHTTATSTSARPS